MCSEPIRRDRDASSVFRNGSDLRPLGMARSRRPRRVNPARRAASSSMSELFTTTPPIRESAITKVAHPPGERVLCASDAKHSRSSR